MDIQSAKSWAAELPSPKTHSAETLAIRDKTVSLCELISGMGKIEIARKERRGLISVTPIQRFRRHLMKVSGRRFSMHCAYFVEGKK